MKIRRKIISKLFSRGQYGLIVLLLNWSPGIIAVVHMLAYHRYLQTRCSELLNKSYLLGCFK